MITNSPIVGKVKLRSEVNAIPNEGVAVSRLRVELVAKDRPDEAWISELNVIGDLPWHKGEERKAKLRIMSEEFRNYVMQVRPSLIVKSGNEVLGNLTIQKKV